MENFTKTVSIKNFKSIRRAVLDNCRRINLLIGRPNVGKSNILEAFAVFNLHNARYVKDKSVNQFIRTESETQLFFNGDTSKDIEVIVGGDVYRLSDNKESSLSELTGYLNEESVVSINKLNIKSSGHRQPEETVVKSYFFNSSFSFEETPLRYLQPTTGCNLYKVLKPISKVINEVSDILLAYGLKLSFDSASGQLRFWKDLPSGEVFTVPFSSIADTLQRMIFYKTAIASNSNSIITFEEPEANSYPPYISKITADILYSTSNQFFITTHSPYVVNDFLEDKDSSLAIFVIDYQNGETIVKRLSDEQLTQVYEYGIDLFFNTEIFD